MPRNKKIDEPKEEPKEEKVEKKPDMPIADLDSANYDPKDPYGKRNQ